MSRHVAYLAAAAVLLVLTIGTSAQNPPPVTGTVALEGTINKVYRAARTVLVTTADGVQHVFHFTKNLLVHGGKSPEPFPGLREGTTVVVHYTVQDNVESAQEIDRIGDEGMKTTEGTVTRIDRGKKQLTVRFDDGTTQVFRMTERAAAAGGKTMEGVEAGNTRIVIYYTDEGGQRVAHYFRQIS